jgi:hypothetical protein
MLQSPLPRCTDRSLQSPHCLECNWFLWECSPQSWPKTGCNGGVLWKLRRTFRFHKRRPISWSVQGRSHIRLLIAFYWICIFPDGLARYVCSRFPWRSSCSKNAIQRPRQHRATGFAYGIRWGAPWRPKHIWVSPSQHRGAQNLFSAKASSCFFVGPPSTFYVYMDSEIKISSQREAMFDATFCRFLREYPRICLERPRKTTNASIIINYVCVKIRSTEVLNEHEECNRYTVTCGLYTGKNILLREFQKIKIICV